MKCCCRKKSARVEKKKEEDVANQKEEMWTTDNVRDPSEKRSRDETSYFDPSYDYMG